MAFVVSTTSHSKHALGREIMEIKAMEMKANKKRKLKKVFFFSKKYFVSKSNSCNANIKYYLAFCYGGKAI